MWGKGHSSEDWESMNVAAAAEAEAPPPTAPVPTAAPKRKSYEQEPCYVCLGTNPGPRGGNMRDVTTSSASMMPKTFDPSSVDNGTADLLGIIGRRPPTGMDAPATAQAKPKITLKPNTKQRATPKAPSPLVEDDDAVLVVQNAPARQAKIESSNDEVLEVQNARLGRLNTNSTPLHQHRYGG